MADRDHQSCAALRFIDLAADGFARARDRVGSVKQHVAIGGRIICLEFAGQALVPLLLPALEHLIAEPVEQPGLTVRLFDSETTCTAMPPAPWGRNAYRARGEIAGFNDDRIRTVYQPGTDALNVYDRHRHSAIYWVRRPADVPYWETGAPLRAILHWWLDEAGVQLVHGGSVGYTTGGVLLCGPGGSGKSTSTLACLGSDLLYGGDDYVVVSVGDAPQTHSLYQTAKLDSNNLDRFQHLWPLVHNPTKLVKEKAILFLGRHYPQRMARGFPLRALVVPRVTGRRDSRLSAATPAVGVAALAPTTMFQLPGDPGRVFSRIAALAAKVPTFVLEAGTELPQIPALIGQFLRERA
jgi:hypothetical protein